jgi:hypothetical protein
MRIVTTRSAFCGQIANQLHVEEKNTDVSQIFFAKIRMKIREVLFGENYYMKSAGNLNSKADTLVCGSTPLPQARQ